MRKIIQRNGIILLYIFAQLFVLFFSFPSDSVLGDSNKIKGALIIHTIIVLLVILGYFINKIFTKNSKRGNIKYSVSFKKSFFPLSYFLICLGVLTSILTIGTIVSPQEYLIKLLSQNSEIVDIRQQSGDGGLSGIFKMFNILPLTVYLITASILNFGIINDLISKRLLKLNKFALIGLLVKVIFSLDRLSIMAILLVQFYFHVITNQIRLKYFFILFSILFVGIFITSARMPDSSFIEFIIIYCKLSIVNFQMVLSSSVDFSYGFQTFLTPLLPIFRIFGFEYVVNSPDEWVWNPAQYFNSYLFLDFGYCSLIFYPFLGVFFRYVEVSKRNKNTFYLSSYFLIIFTVATFISVPFVRGIEFWICILTCWFLSRYLITDKKIV